MFQRLSLAQRMTLTTGSVVLVVMIAHALISERTMSAQVVAWEREQVAGIAHHVAEMVAAHPPAGVQQYIAETASGLQPFGIEVAFSPTDYVKDDGLVSVPLAGGLGFVTARGTEDLAGTLKARLRRSSVWLALILLVTLLGTVLGAIHWGVTRPLRRVKKQLLLMARGPWRVEMKPGGVAEIEILAKQIEGVGASLERSIGSWVAAERRAVSEGARLNLRRKAIPILREINITASGLLAAGEISANATRTVRRMLAAVDRLTALLGEPLDPSSFVAEDLNPPVESFDAKISHPQIQQLLLEAFR